MATQTHGFYRYRVFFTVLDCDGEYGETLEVTQDIDITDLVKQISGINNEIDNGDYDIGVFTFGDITLSAINTDRKFSPPEDWKSIFPYSRDKTKVDVYLYDDENNRTLSFRGLINDDATRADVLDSVVKFRVLSLDSIFRQVQVSGGQVSTDQSFSVAIKAILNVPAITTVVNYDPANITLGVDLNVDDGDYFTDLTAKAALDELLTASNSVLYIDRTDTLYVKPRIESSNVYYFYGRGDAYGRNNITKIRGFNTGVQRAFSSVKVSETVRTDSAFVELYGFRQKWISFDFVTNTESHEQIANTILTEFKTPRQELEIEVLIRDSNAIELLDQVSIDLPYRLILADGEETLPSYGVAQYGAAKYPQTQGSYRIDSSSKWKVIGIRENPKSLTKVLKLRLAGSNFGGGVF